MSNGWGNSPFFNSQITSVEVKMLVQSSLFPDIVDEQQLDADPDWRSDDWETPNWLGKAMSNLVLLTDQVIVDAGAGTGQLTKHLPVMDAIHCFEMNPERVQMGKQKTDHNPSVLWHERDYLNVSPVELKPHLVIGNPPFSILMHFLDQSLQLLDHEYEHARVLFLLPGNCFQAKQRNAYFKRLGCHIHHCYQITGRVAYLKNGKPHPNRQVEDSIFDIRPGVKPGGISFIENPKAL